MVKEIKQAKNNTIDCLKRLLFVVCVILAVLPLAGALYGVWYVRGNIDGFAVYSLLFTNVIAGFAGLTALYVLTIKLERKNAKR